MKIVLSVIYLVKKLSRLLTHRICKKDFKENTLGGNDYTVSLLHKHPVYEYINLFGPFMKVRERWARGLMNPLHSSPTSLRQPFPRSCNLNFTDITFRRYIACSGWGCNKSVPFNELKF